MEQEAERDICTCESALTGAKMFELFASLARIFVWKTFALIDRQKVNSSHRTIIPSTGAGYQLLCDLRRSFEMAPVTVCTLPLCCPPPALCGDGLMNSRLRLVVMRRKHKKASLQR